MKNKIKETFLTLIIGDYILEQATKDRMIYMTPRPFAWLRDKYLYYKINQNQKLTRRIDCAK